MFAVVVKHQIVIHVTDLIISELNEKKMLILKLRTGRANQFCGKYLKILRKNQIVMMKIFTDFVYTLKESQK